MKHPLQIAALLVLLLAAATTGVVSVRRVGDQIAVLEGCDAASHGDWGTTLEKTRGRTGPDDTGRAAAQCRCRALLASEQPQACAELLESVLGERGADGWAPDPALSVHLIQTWRDAGRGLEAAELARRATRTHPDDPDLFYLELLTRSSVEDEEPLLAELEGRVARRGPAAVRMRVSLANRHLLRGDAARALEALGYVPPRGAGDTLAGWFEARGHAFAAAGDLDGVKRTYERWRNAGGDLDELAGRYALTLSIGKIRDPETPTVELLRRALASEPDDAGLEELLTVRLVLSLVADARLDEALAAYDRGRERFALEGLTREEIERAATHRELAALPPERRRGELHFVLPEEARGGRLLLSPDSEQAVDTRYRPLAVPASRQIALTSPVGVAPRRWVLLDRRGGTLASGTANPTPGRPVEIEVRAGRAFAREPAALLRRPGDGRRRIALLLLDCADWRIVQYLRARGELAVLSKLIETGHSAVLHSDPPLTAAALEALVSPRLDGRPSFLGVVHRFGIELAGLASVGENPFGALGWVLPETPDLFSVVGAGPRSAANLLFAHGSIRSGRHAVVTGPGGTERRIPISTSARDLHAHERSRFPALAALRRDRDAVHVRTIAAEFDVAEQMVRAAEVDLLMLRIEPLDILTHAHFAEAVKAGQDDGAGLLFSVYRYIDARLGVVHDLLDEDDVLIVMSDHGIRTAMEHSPHALFVASGAGVPGGRAPGAPDLRGVPRVLAELLEVETDWPRTGVADWPSLLAAGPALAPGTATAHPAASRP